MTGAIGGGRLPVEDHLVAGFVRSAAAAPDATAVEVERERWSYERLLRVSAAIAHRLEATVAGEAPARTAVFAHRSWVAYAGLLAALMRGHAYLPLKRRFPVTRTREMFERSGSRAIVVDDASLVQLEGVLADVAEKTVSSRPARRM